MGKTHDWCQGACPNRKHPHGRGEDSRRSPDNSLAMETPPRAWGRRSALPGSCAKVRNTPTGVGKTAAGSAPVGPARKHPHGRGEDQSRPSSRMLSPETPPRAWGRQHCLRAQLRRARNTPTGVGKTSGCGWAAWANQKHPHGRGEDLAKGAGSQCPTETPPRAWGRRRVMLSWPRRVRNTPTGVGKTWV